ncbi:MAG TPA: hypothetical protein VNU97_16525 [Rhizomicrobium sp.]|jgi:hypothetical protein|nr:hypothetical protein [Rhizomicrobium sp.]
MGAEPPADLFAFLHGETDAANFHHADHLRMAFEILRRHRDFLEAAQAYRGALKIIAARAGNAGAYHETITLAFLSLIAEQMATRNYENFSTFVTQNADLLDKFALLRWYPSEQLDSAAARATFVLPRPREASR